MSVLVLGFRRSCGPNSGCSGLRLGNCSEAGYAITRLEGIGAAGRAVDRLQMIDQLPTGSVGSWSLLGKVSIAVRCAPPGHAFVPADSAAFDHVVPSMPLEANRSCPFGGAIWRGRLLGPPQAHSRSRRLARPAATSCGANPVGFGSPLCCP